jgi:cell division cycle 20-like protein 1 (cofactor of APC complex)
MARGKTKAAAAAAAAAAATAPTSAPAPEHTEKDVATPALISPPESKTPPTASHKRNQLLGTSEPIDASALSKALEHFEQAGKTRERTPTTSPSRKRPRIYGDR